MHLNRFNLWWVLVYIFSLIKYNIIWCFFHFEIKTAHSWDVIVTRMFYTSLFCNKIIFFSNYSCWSVSLTVCLTEQVFFSHVKLISKIRKKFSFKLLELVIWDENHRESVFRMNCHLINYYLKSRTKNQFESLKQTLNVFFYNFRFKSTRYSTKAFSY